MTINIKLTENEFFIIINSLYDKRIIESKNLNSINKINKLLTKLDNIYFKNNK